MSSSLLHDFKTIPLPNVEFIQAFFHSIHYLFARPSHRKLPKVTGWPVGL